MTPAPNSRGSVWFVLTLAVAVMLWLSVWVSQPKLRSNRFVYEEAIAATWPDSPLFAIPDAHRPVFFDLQVLLNGIELATSGRHPHTVAATPERPYWYNWPSSWLILRHSGANLHWTRPLGLAMGALFLAAVLFACRPRDALTAGAITVLLVAPTSVGVIALANIEEIIFALLVFTAWAASRPSPTRWFALPALALAGLLKLYPACALPALLDGRRRTALTLLATAGALALYFELNLSDLREVSRITPRPHYNAIGSLVLASRLLDAPQRHAALATAFDKLGGIAPWYYILPTVSVLTFLLLTFLAGRMGWRHSVRDTLENDEPAFPSLLFRLSACMYLGCFLIGHNWYYREVILLPAIPWLISRPGARALVVVIIALAWLGWVNTGPIFFLVQTGTWLLAGGLAYWLVRNLAPDVHRTWRDPRATLTRSRAS